ncbi:unnamed protein product [Effrenium voratum]|nr:unnamed protein product [Effrenium voratum]
MFKGFTPGDVSGQNQVKSSVQRAIKTKIQEQFPRLEPVFKDIWPKDASMVIAKCKDHISMVVIEKVPLFWQERDGPWLPTLRLLHKYPSMMPKMQVDKGAIKFVLRGASVMCPGLTSKGGAMEDVEEGVCVQVTAEGTETLGCRSLLGWFRGRRGLFLARSHKKADLEASEERLLSEELKEDLI